MSEPISLGSLLNISKKDVDKAMSLLKEDDPGADENLGPAIGLVADLASAKLNEALEKVDCLELLGQAWGKWKTLREYADRKKHPPGEAAVVTLGEHKVKHECFPLAELKTAGVKTPLAELKLTLVLTAKFKSVSLAIRDGKVLSAAPGEASVEVALKYKSVEIARRPTPSWKLPGRIPFGEGIQIPA